MKRLTQPALALVFASVLAAQPSLPPPFPRPNATKLLETDRIVVWDIVWPKGQPTPMHRHVYDQVGTYYARGGRLVTMPDGTSRSAMTEIGRLSTTRKGTTHIEEGTTDPPLRAVFIELKQETGSGLPVVSTAGTAPFPRDAAKQTLDDDRATVWDVTWASSSQFKYRPTRDTVVVWLGEGKLRTTRDGATSITEVKPGTMRYLAHDSPETVEILEGAPRAMIFELK